MVAVVVLAILLFRSGVSAVGANKRLRFEPGSKIHVLAGSSPSVFFFSEFPPSLKRSYSFGIITGLLVPKIFKSNVFDSYVDHGEDDKIPEPISDVCIYCQTCRVVACRDFVVPASTQLCTTYVYRMYVSLFTAATSRN